MAWPIHGNGALEVLRVMDWAAQAFDVSPNPGVGHATVPAVMDNRLAWFIEYG